MLPKQPTLCGYNPGTLCDNAPCAQCPTYRNFKQPPVKTFSDGMLANLLTEQHKNMGLYLVEDEDFVYIMRTGDNISKAIFNSTTVTFAEIRYEADQIMNWAKSGICFEKVGAGNGK